ncbi:MAG: hypothetical protein LBH93_06135 [Chitinispirillales bacterium]|jgi:lysozyme|nr:hypothetical protein [Chitinispirillales bacterium]
MSWTKITLLFFIAAILLLGTLLHTRKIWFVYPNKGVYAVDGLDVSHHQGIIDWENVDAKYRFVFVKATEAVTFVDSKFYENAKSVKSTGRILGAYHFFHFNYGGAEQADNFINTAGDIIDLPPVVDFEYTGSLNEPDKDRIAEELRICVSRLEEHYKHKAIIYTTKDAYKQIVKDNFDNPLWYRSIVLPISRNVDNAIFWQYHNSAMVRGVGTRADLNVFKGDIAELKELIMGINPPYPKSPYLSAP